MMQHQGLRKVKEYLLQPVEVMLPFQLILSHKQQQQCDIQDKETIFSSASTQNYSDKMQLFWL